MRKKLSLILLLIFCCSALSGCETIDNAIATFKGAMVTCGGVSTKDVDASTLESKKIKNLFITGELLDLDAETGGYNLQIAFSTGYLAGLSL